jgi:S-adenosylmethionine-diacylglycerol 3-amino-3-carboxypropyl transferase
MITDIKNKIFHKIHTGNLVYNTCWEDPRCDRALLDIQSGSRVVMLTSAGCNALDYLLDDPQSIDCVDMNPRQNALLDFKSVLFQKSDHETLFSFFGHGRHRQAKEVFQETVGEYLDAFPRQFWSRNLHFFEGKGIRKSFYWYGSAGAAAFFVKKVLESSPETRKLLHQLFDCNNLETQRELYFKLEPRLMNMFTRWLFNRHVFQSMLGVPQTQQALAKKTFQHGMAGYVQQCFRKVFTEQSLSDNYFWKVYLLGAYSTDCCPNYLRREHFNTLRSRVNRLQTHSSTLSQFLQNNPGQYTHFILLDHQDWLAAHNRPALQEEWQLILQNCAPNAKILMRSAAATVDFIPEFVYDKLRFNPTKTEAIQATDRVGTYASTLLGELN